MHELVEAVGGLDPACRDRGVLADVVASSARLRAWLDGRDVAVAAQVEQVVVVPGEDPGRRSRASSLKDAERTVKRAQTTRMLPAVG